MEPTEHLDAARTAYRKRAWHSAAMAYGSAADLIEVPVDDMARWATAAFLSGAGSQALDILQILFHRLENEQDTQEAAKTAYLLGFILLERGEVSKGSAWLARAQRQLESGAQDGSASGYLAPEGPPAAHGRAAG